MHTVRSAGALSRHVAAHREWSLLLAAGAIAAVLFTDLVGIGVFHPRYSILNASSAGSWSHGVAALALAAGAAVCVLGAQRLPRQRAVWVATALILTLFFADEVSGLHASIDALSYHGVSYGKLMYAPILLVLVLCVWRMMIGSAHLTSLRTGAVLLLVSYLLHLFDPHIAPQLLWSKAGWVYQVKIGLKEGTELAGLLLVLLAMCGTALAESDGHPRSVATSH